VEGVGVGQEGEKDKVSCFRTGWRGEGRQEEGKGISFTLDQEKVQRRKN
jgi:hypothetical protein